MKTQRRRPHNSTQFKGAELVGRSTSRCLTIVVVKRTTWHAIMWQKPGGYRHCPSKSAFGRKTTFLPKKRASRWSITRTTAACIRMVHGKGQLVWDVNKESPKPCWQMARVFAHRVHQTPVSHCHRCDTKLVHRAHPSWFMDMMVKGRRCWQKTPRLTGCQSTSNTAAQKTRVRTRLEFEPRPILGHRHAGLER